MNQLSDIKKYWHSLSRKWLKNIVYRTLGLLGSIVRNDFSSASDIDIVVDFDQPIGIELVDLANFIENRLQHKIDLVSKNGIKEKYFKAVEREIVYV